MAMIIKCPICKTPVDQSRAEGAKFFPFCSDRCRLIDLGRWLDGKYQIPADDDDFEAPPSPMGDERDEDLPKRGF